MHSRWRTVLWLNQWARTWRSVFRSYTHHRLTPSPWASHVSFPVPWNDSTFFLVLSNLTLSSLSQELQCNMCTYLSSTTGPWSCLAPATVMKNTHHNKLSSSFSLCNKLAVPLHSPPLGFCFFLTTSNEGSCPSIFYVMCLCTPAL